MGRHGRIRRLALGSLLSAVALVLGYLEAMIPLPVSVPGIKLGLANVAVAVALVTDGPGTAGVVALVKVLASGLVFGSPTMLAYSLGGTALSYLGMLALSRVPGMGLVPVCMLGAILHNAGQLAVAALVLGTPSVFLSLPVLAVAACVTGSVTGAVAQAALASLAGVGDEDTRPRVEGSIELHPGELVAFVGRNGSGKTSFALQLARELGGEEPAAPGGPGDGRDDAGNPAAPEEGPDGAACTGDARGTRHLEPPVRTGLAFQDPDDQIVAALVRDDVAFGPEGQGMPREQMRAVVREALAQAGLGDGCEGREVATLSGGERQRVAVAGVLALAPGLVVFDESTSMLDPAARRRFAGLVRSLTGRGMAVVVVTQLMDEAFAADRVALFDQGRLAAVRTPQELLGEPELLGRLGLELPPVARLSAGLREEGLPVPLTDDAAELEEALACCAARG